MRSRLALAVACTVLVVAWSSSDAGAQTCPDDASAPQATSEQVDFTGVMPGEHHTWSTTVTNTYDHPVAVRASLDGSGVLAAALRVGLRACATPWHTSGTGPATCATGATVLVTPTTLDDGVEVDLPALAPAESWHARFSAELPASAGNELQGSSGAVRSLMVWQQQCGPATTTTTTLPTPPTAVPVTVPPTGAPTTSPTTAPTTTPSPTDRTPRPRAPRAGRPAGPGNLPLTGSPAALMGAMAAGLLLAGSATLVAGRRRRRDAGQVES